VTEKPFENVSVTLNAVACGAQYRASTTGAAALPLSVVTVSIEIDTNPQIASG
jgi:hypothetical protein